MSFRYPLANTSWDQAEFDAMQRVIASGMFTMGANVAAFEHAFAGYVGSRHCVMVNSGSSANLLMVAALFFTGNPSLRLKAGDEVIVPAVSWSTTYYPLHQYGLRLKFVDVDPQTLNYDLDQLAAAVGDRTRLIMAVNLLGNPNDFGRIDGIVAGRDIVLIEDNCESMGATYGNRMAGTFGVMGSFSSFFSHHISTMEGGLIVTDDEELYQILLSLRAHGWTRNLPKHNLVCGEKSDDPFQESYRFVLPGYNVRPLELSGAIGVEQLYKLPDMIEMRRRNAEAVLNIVADHRYIRPQQEIGESSWFGFSLIVEPDAPFDRQALIHTLTAQGIEVRPIVAGNFARNDVLKWFDYEIHGDLVAADEVNDRGLFIGNHHYPLEAELGLLRAALDTLPRTARRPA